MTLVTIVWWRYDAMLVSNEYSFSYIENNREPRGTCTNFYIIYPFPNFNGGTVEVWEGISNFITHFTSCVITYLCRNLSDPTGMMPLHVLTPS